MRVLSQGPAALLPVSPPASGATCWRWESAAAATPCRRATQQPAHTAGQPCLPGWAAQRGCGRSSGAASSPPRSDQTSQPAPARGERGAGWHERRGGRENSMQQLLQLVWMASEAASQRDDCTSGAAVVAGAQLLRWPQRPSLMPAVPTCLTLSISCCSDRSSSVPMVDTDTSVCKWDKRFKVAN